MKLNSQVTCISLVQKDLFSQSKENSLEVVVLKEGKAERRRELTQRAKEHVLYAGSIAIAAEVERRGQSPELLEESSARSDGQLDVEAEPYGSI